MARNPSAPSKSRPLAAEPVRSAEPLSSQGTLRAIAFSTWCDGLAGRDPLLVGVEARDLGVPAVGQLAALHLRRSGPRGRARRSRRALLPLVAQARAALADPGGEVLVDTVGDEELGVLGPAVGALRLPHLLLAERLAVGRRRVLLVRRAVADVAVDDDQGRAVRAPRGSARRPGRSARGRWRRRPG